MSDAEDTVRRRADHGSKDDGDVVGMIDNARRALVVFVVGSVLLVSGIAYAIVELQNISKRVADVEHGTPCRVDPASEACQKFVADVFAELPPAIACDLYRDTLSPQAYDQLTRCEPRGG